MSWDQSCTCDHRRRLTLSNVPGHQSTESGYWRAVLWLLHRGSVLRHHSRRGPTGKDQDGREPGDSSDLGSTLDAGRLWPLHTLADSTVRYPGKVRPLSDWVLAKAPCEVPCLPVGSLPYVLPRARDSDGLRQIAEPLE